MYFIRRLFSIDVSRMFETVKKISKRSNRAFISVFFDVIITAFACGAGYMDYFVFNFDNLTMKERKTYINRTVNNAYIKHMNNREYYHLFDNKNEFLKYYKDFIHRDFLDLTESTFDDFVAFCGKHEEFMAKPINGLCGYGIELVNVKDQNLQELYDEIIAKNQLLLEERIKQCDEMNEMYPHSVNTLRVVTCLKEDDVHILFVALRIGNGGRNVDNFNSGGVFTVVDEDGVVRKKAVDKEGNEYDIHPYTNKEIIGFKIPRFDEIIAECKKMALITKEVGLTGWDMCVTQDGIDCVEGNQLPGYDIYQSRPHLDDVHCGLKPRFDAIIYK